MKRRILIVLLSLVLVGSLAGIGAVAYSALLGGYDPLLGKGAYVNPPPWSADEPLTPVSTEERPHLQSYARAQQIEEWMKTRMTLPGEQEPDQWSETLAFDKTARERGKRTDSDIPAGLLAGQRAHVSGISVDETRNFLDVMWFTSIEARDGYRDLRVPAASREEGASVVHQADTCTRGGYEGQLDSVYAYAPAGDHLLISTGASCVPVANVEDEKGRARAAATIAVKEARALEQEPMPATLFDRTSEFPVISSGFWHDQQTVVNPSLDDRADRVLPANVRRDGVEVFIQGRDDVVVLKTVEQAKRMINSEFTSSHPNPTTRQQVDYADEQACREGKYYQQGTQCWTRTGRIVVISRHDHDGEVQVKDQIELLPG